MHFASCLGDEAGSALKAEIVASGYIEIFDMEFHRLEELCEMGPIAKAIEDFASQILCRNGTVSKPDTFQTTKFSVYSKQRH